jgi:hypothetical protein
MGGQRGPLKKMDKEIREMQRKRLALILLLTVIFIATSAHSATLSLEWYTCTVTKAGPGGKKQVFITLTDAGDQFTEKTFAAAKGREKEMLAVALTALTSSATVSVSSTPYSDGITPIIYDIYLLKQ